MIACKAHMQLTDPMSLEAHSTVFSRSLHPYAGSLDI